MPKSAFQNLRFLGHMFFAPDKGDGTGGGNKPTIEEQLTSARSEIDRVNGLLATMTGERDTARGEVQALTKERDDLKSQFDSATELATSLRKELTDANSKLATVTGERDKATSDLNSANGNVSRLEKLCSIRGIDPKSAVEPGHETGAPKSLADFQAEMANAKTQEEKDRVISEFTKTVKKS